MKTMNEYLINFEIKRPKSFKCKAKVKLIFKFYFDGHFFKKLSYNPFNL
jgi:hypothetical protein